MILPCCMNDTPINRDIAIKMAMHEYNRTGEKNYIVVIKGRLQARTESQLKMLELIMPNTRAINDYPEK